MHALSTSDNGFWGLEIQNMYNFLGATVFYFLPNKYVIRLWQFCYCKKVNRICDHSINWFSKSLVLFLIYIFQIFWFWTVLFWWACPPKLPLLFWPIQIRQKDSFGESTSNYYSSLLKRPRLKKLLKSPLQRQNVCYKINSDTMCSNL